MMVVIEDEKTQSNTNFPTNRIKIILHGYGGECYMGEIKREIYEFYKKHEINIEQFSNDWSDELWNFIPEEFLIFPPGSPYDCSDLGQHSGATMDSASTITVEDQGGNTIWESGLDLNSLRKCGVNVELCDQVTLEELDDGTVIFWGGQGEKGTFFNGEIEINEPFDPKKLTINYSNLDGWLLSSSVNYNGEDIEGFDGYDTNGKWRENKFVIIGNEEVYEGRERDEEGELFCDEDTPDGSNNSPEDWEKSQKIKKGNPKRIGWYRCNFIFGTTYGSLYWNGREWQSFSNGRPIKECDSVDWWQGFNWDTSDWNNRPTEPPEAKCQKCNWLGSQDEMPRNRKGDLVCPKCKAKDDDIYWIEYSPDTKVGISNRKKYCSK